MELSFQLTNNDVIRNAIITFAHFPSWISTSNLEMEDFIPLYIPDLTSHPPYP